jgi:hypothetical protein
MWLEDFHLANWDIAVIYYGNKTNFTCPECIHVEYNKGAKWRVVYQFTQGADFQEHYSTQYQQVYMPDDDIIQTGVIINTIFDVQQQYHLDLCQPSLCSATESFTWARDLWKEMPSVLRYTTFIEVMVTQFSMRFFKQSVIPTLRYAESAYGLDWVWPFLMGFPQDRIAIIDEVCVIHPQKESQPIGKASMYDTMSMQPKAEEASAYKRWHYTSQVLDHRFGMKWREQSRLGQVWQPWYAEMLRQAGLKAVNERAAIGSGPAKGIKLVPDDRMLALLQPGAAELSTTDKLDLGRKAGSPDAKLPQQQQNQKVLSSEIIQHDLEMSGFASWLTTPLNAPKPTMSPRGKRRNLVVAVVRDKQQVPGWLAHNEKATWDLVLYSIATLELECSHCLFAEQFPQGSNATRFQLMYNLTQTELWGRRVGQRGYDYVYFPEDDIVQNVDMVNRLFELMQQHKLDLGHPSLCSNLDSDMRHLELLHSAPTMVLRYTTWVGLTAPAFSMAFFEEHVMSTLEHAVYGHGLDWLWPWLAGYPHDKIAVLDDMCVMRPTHLLPPKGRSKQLTAQQEGAAQEEERDQLERFGYNPAARGLHERPVEVVGYVPQPWYASLLQKGGLQVVMVQRSEVVTTQLDRRRFLNDAGAPQS